MTELLAVNGSSRSTLTDQEIEAAYLAHHDLGPGYPQLPLPEHITSLYLDDTIEALSLKFSPEWTPAKQELVDSDLYLSLRRFLSLPPGSYQNVHCTFSGSVALDRAFTAAIDLVTARRSDRVTVVTTSPCIDIMKLFLAERRLLDVKFVESRAVEPWGLTLNGVIDAIRSASAAPRRRALIVLLTSPENPTGQWWRAGELQAISDECARCGAVMIVDHTFLTAGVQGEGEVAAVWNTGPASHNWIAIWDTGKTFGLNEDKLGFIITGSESVDKAVRKALGVLQFGVARRQKLFFAEMLRRAYYLDHITDLRKICRTNLETVQECTNGTALELVTPEAGSLALLRLPETCSDESVRTQLLGHGVGVVAGSVFFHTEWSPSNLIRVALAREPSYFRVGFERLLSEVMMMHV